MLIVWSGILIVWSGILEYHMSRHVIGFKPEYRTIVSVVLVHEAYLYANNETTLIKAALKQFH